MPARATRTTSAPPSPGTIRSTSGKTSPPLHGVIRDDLRPHGVGAPDGARSAAAPRATNNDRTRNFADAPAVLCNITPQSWILHRTHGTFFVAGANSLAQGADDARVAQGAARSDGPEAVASEYSTNPLRAAAKTASHPEPHEPAAAPHGPFALTEISARTGAIDLGDKRTLEFPISARDIADDLAREINSDGGEGSYFGVFVCEGDEPTADELAAARAQLNAFYRNLVAAADRQWERTHNVMFISDLERRAARELRLEKDWSYEPGARFDCPACGEKLRPGVAVCRVCRAVLDAAKAARFGLAAPAAASPNNSAKSA
jgi:hypothetical protein